MKVVQATACFMCKASGIYKNEDTRRSAIRPKLSNVLSVGMEKVVNLDLTSADGVVLTQALMMGEVAAIGIEEEKNEFGDGGSDPSTQAGLSYGRFWAQPNVCASNLLVNSLIKAYILSMPKFERTAGVPLFLLQSLVHQSPSGRIKSSYNVLPTTSCSVMILSSTMTLSIVMRVSCTPSQKFA
jgi:hypothetical protein